MWRISRYLISFILFLWIPIYVTASEILTVSGSFTTPEIISDTSETHAYPISIPSTGIVAEVTVSIDVNHSHPLNLQIRLKHNNETVILFSGWQIGLPVGATGIKATYDYPDRPVTTLSKFTGLEVSGNWVLEILDYAYGDGLSGTLNSWSIQIELAQFGYLEAFDGENRSLRLQVDGYGSFGDFKNGTLLGAEFNDPHIKTGRTTYSSALYLHSPNSNEQRFLTSLDSFYGDRLPSIPISETREGMLESWFTLGKVDVYLTQRLISVGPEEGRKRFLLLQDYEFANRNENLQFYEVSRFFNPDLRFGSSSGQDNYFFPKHWEGFIPDLYIFDTLETDNLIQTPWMAISFRSDYGYYPVYRVSDWIVKGKQFDEILETQQLNVYDWDETVSHADWRDYDGDGFTDPGSQNGFDVTVVQGCRLPFNQNQRTMRYVSLTWWGYSSPADVASATDYYQYEFPTVVPTPIRTPTKTPTPTRTPTPTKIPIPPHWIKPLPDVRLIANREAKQIVDLSEYIADPDTLLEKMEISWIVEGPFTLEIDKENRYLSAQANEFSNEIGKVDLLVQDRTASENFIRQSFRVKISTFLTESFRPIPPIVFAPGETSYTSPYRLMDFLHEYDEYPEGSFDSTSWSTMEPLPDGIESVTIHDDTRFTVIAKSDWVGGSVVIPFKVHRLYPDTPTPEPTATETPLPTSTPTATFTPTPTFTPSATFTPTATHTSVPTSTNTPSPTSTPTPTFTPTATNTSTPTRTPTSTWTPTPSPTNTSLPASPTFTWTPTRTHTYTPTSTPIPPTPTLTQIPVSPTPTLPLAFTPTPSMPSPTPTPGCLDVFRFSRIVISNTKKGPVDWIQVPRVKSDSENEDISDELFAVSHYDDGVIGFYSKKNDLFELESQILAPGGSTNLAFGEFNGDATPDLFVLNPVQESLTVYVADREGGYQSGSSLSLHDDQVPDLYDLSNGSRYQSLAVGAIDNDNVDDAFIRSRDSILLVLSKDNRMQISDRLSVDGVVRLIKGNDLDGDGDMDLLVSLRKSDGEENILVYRNQSSNLVLVQTLRPDLTLKGNNPEELVLQDLDGDGFSDLVILLFSGAVQQYQGQADGTFALVSEHQPYPLGVIAAFEVVDLDGDGKIEWVTLLRNQEGLSLLVACNQDDARQVGRYPISSSAPTEELYVLRILDLDEDGDPDILFSRNFEDQLIWIENGIVASDHSQ